MGSIPSICLWWIHTTGEWGGAVSLGGLEERCGTGPVVVVHPTHPSDGELGRHREDLEFKAILSYMSSLRPAWATRDLCQNSHTEAAREL